MNLTQLPDFVNWSVTHYVFSERVGPFQENAQKAWQNFFAAQSKITEKISGRISLYKLEPKMIYRAGVIVEAKPAELPEGLQYEKFEGGRYARYVLTGSYQNLPAACGEVFKMFPSTNIQIRADAFYIENYVNDPKSTPEEKLVTEILIPIV